MTLFLWLFLIIISFIMIKSMALFLKGGKFRNTDKQKESKFSIEIFYTLLIVYLIIIVGFGLIYFILSIQGIVLVEYGDPRPVGVVGSIIHSFYFSGVTLLTIGYGDIVPIGVGRVIAIIEALIGYALPTAFVVRLVQFRVRD